MPIFCDLDEVLVDFTTLAAQVHGIEIGELPIPYSFGMDDEKFWQPIRILGERFWLEIKPFDWAQDVFELVKEYAPNDWYIVTRPGPYTASYTGKIKWLHKYLGPDLDRCTVTRKPKCMLANANSLLIDDSIDNVDAFEACGGSAIMFPSRLNKLHPIWQDPVPYLKEQLEAYDAS